MAGKFVLKKFENIDISDTFFDSLKADYPGTKNSTGFLEWFTSKPNRTALVFEDENGIGAFVALKSENEFVQMKNGCLKEEKRIKISTIKISERHRGERYGEGAIGLLLWYWQKSGLNQIYVTVFDKHITLIKQLVKFGFVKKGYNLNCEGVYVKDRRTIDYSDAYKSFPFVNKNMKYAGYVIFDAIYHDTMFAYSKLKNKDSLQMEVGRSVTNGISKIYVGKAPVVNYYIGEPVLIYRKDELETPGKRYRSCITSFAIVTDVIQPKVKNHYMMSFEQLLQHIGNKSVFDEGELYRQYSEYHNVTVVSLLYYAYFGEGNNVNLDWLEKHDCWTTDPNQYPTSVHLDINKFEKILKEGNINVSDVIIN